MDIDEAKAILESYGYIPGVHRTEGMEPEKRARIKAACAVLAASPIPVEVAKPAPVEPPKPQPRRPEDVPGYGVDGGKRAKKEG